MFSILLVNHKITVKDSKEKHIVCHISEQIKGFHKSAFHKLLCL